MALDFRRVVVLVFVAVLVAGTAIGSRRFAVLLPASEIEAVRLLESARPDRPGKAAPHHAAQSTATPEVVKPGRRQFTVYRAPSGELVCREATAEEIRERQSIDPQTRGLRRINHFELDKSASSQAPEASNLIIVLRGTQQLQQNAAATAAFNRAAQNWENVIMSPVTIYIDVDFGPTDFGDPWPDNVLGATGSPSGAFSYQAVRTALMAQANSEGDATKFAVFSSLPPVTLPTDLGDGSGVDLSDSIARAIGLLPATAQPANDASQIAFNSNNTFDFDPSNGITANAIDFEAVATHEIGHALGFDSDGGLNLPRPTVWDLYRFRTGTTASTFPSAQRIITVGGSPDPLQFDFIPGNPELGLSTGGPTGSDALGGDGWQSSHWKHVDTCGGTIGIMDPAIPEGCRRTITSNDQLALGSFGYNLTNNNGAPAAASPTPPANDNFANAQTITGCSGSAGGTSFGATSESGEPSHDPSDATSLSPSRSIWFQWQAPFSTATTITTLGSDFDTVVAVYTGSAVGSLTRVAFNDDQVNGSVRTSKLTFNPIAGTTYKIAVDGWGRDAGTVKLNWDGCPTSTPSPTPTPTPTPSPSPTPTPTPDPPCNGIFAVTDNGDADDANLGDGLCLTAGGACTLRAAVQQSNAMPKCGPVNVNLQGRSGTITLGSALGVITHGTTFNGPGADRLTIQRSSAAGTPPFNIFVINFGVGVSISGITISNGVGATNAGGGAIHNFGILTLANSAISGNQSLDGGGGGIVNDSGGSLNGGTMVILNSTISGNQTTADTNGGARGGGIFNSGTSLTIINSTISGNKAGDGGLVTPDGGGIFNFKGAVKLINCTVTANRTGITGRGGGINSNLVFGGSTSLQNTIVANNFDGSNGAAPDVSGPFVSRDFNLFGSTADATFSGSLANSMQTSNAGLGPLGNNGGHVMTHALLPGSPARDRGSNSLAVDDIGQALGTDGRGSGFARIFNGTVDIGAFEASNSIDLANFFVKQHYLDFLNRQPDQSGLDFWTNEITSCGADVQCVEAKRIHVSAAFFLSIEFQQTGNLVYKMYKAAFGNAAGKPVAVDRAPFLADTRQIQSTPVQVIVGQGNWQAQINTNKDAFALAFVQRPAFQAIYGNNNDAASYVSLLFSKTGASPLAGETSAAIAAFTTAGGGNAGRAAALRSVAESDSVTTKLNNEAFVLMQYFGYLQRNPYDPPEPTLDYVGYNFWLNKLNQFNGDFVAAEMVRAFISSTEYRQRFGP